MIITMGVSGCGKTTIGKLLADKLEIPYFDADDFHPQVNIDKMEKGIPLTDEDRYPWLSDLANKMVDWEKNGGAVLSCSALKEDYRQILMSKVSEVRWVYLFGSYDVIVERMEKRGNHYMKSNLLQSQFDALEEPNYGIKVSILAAPHKIVEAILSKLNPYA
jgi:carbohydrate kinase (thermoresistant glucokinase family)